MEVPRIDPELTQFLLQVLPIDAGVTGGAPIMCLVPRKLRQHMNQHHATEVVAAINS